MASGLGRVSIIIRCCNEEHHIGRLLEGIGQQTVSGVEVIVVDSGSTDATLAIASRYPVKIISINREDFSFGYALNVGCSAATGDLLVLASAHVYPLHRDWLERLLAPFANEKVALVYGRQVGNELANFAENQVLRKWFPEKSDSNQDHPFCNNANAAVRRSLWERFPYDETLTGLEDLAWARQAMGAGYRIAYEAQAEVVHVHNERPQLLLNRYRREAIALKRIFPEERFGLLDFIHRLSQNVVSDLFHAARQGVLWQSLPGIMVFRCMQFWGTYRGFAQHGAVTRQLRQKFYYPNELATAGPRTIESETVRHRIDYGALPDREDD